MIGYITVGTNDLVNAGKFYDALFKVIGAKRTMDFESFILWGTDPAAPGFAIIKPYNKKKATAGNGTMVALAMKNPAQVKKFYDKAVALGAKDEGAPGPRSDTFYAGYFRDLDGNKLNAYCITQAKKKK